MQFKLSLTPLLLLKARFFKKIVYKIVRYKQHSLPALCYYRLELLADVVSCAFIV